jgi:hypothetical protein
VIFQLEEGRPLAGEHLAPEFHRRQGRIAIQRGQQRDLDALMLNLVQHPANSFNNYRAANMACSPASLALHGGLDSSRHDILAN